MKKKPGLSAGESLGKGKVGTEELSGRGKGDSLKIELAVELRKQTAMSMGWICQRTQRRGPEQYLERDEEAA
jgi:hypothetical protein